MENNRMDPTPPQPDPAQPASSPSPVASYASENLPGQMEDLWAQYRFLETIFALTVSALILMSMGVDMYIFKQMRLARTQMHRQRQVVGATLETFRGEKEPLIRSFINKLENFASANPDFRPTLEKYRLELGPYFSTAAPAAKSPPPAASTGATNR